MNRRACLTIWFLFTLLLHLGVGQGAEQATASAADVPLSGYSLPDNVPTGVAHTDHILPAESSDPTVDPAPAQFLFTLQRQSRTSVNLLRNPPVPSSESDPQSFKAPGLLLETAARRRVAACLTSSETLHRSLTVRELLFPFHHFL